MNIKPRGLVVLNILSGKTPKEIAGYSQEAIYEIAKIQIRNNAKIEHRNKKRLKGK